MRPPATPHFSSLPAVLVLWALLVLTGGPGHAIVSCEDVPEGTACNLEFEEPDDCFSWACHDRSCVKVNVPTDQLCRDVDFDVCTVARCAPDTGQCIQAAGSAPNGTSCGSSVGFCGVMACRAGACVATTPGSPAPSSLNPANVLVNSRPQALGSATAAFICDGDSASETLEALDPASLGGSGSVWPRSKVCGEVVDYGVLRRGPIDSDHQGVTILDLQLNLAPSPRFEPFVEGFLNTHCTPVQRMDDMADDFVVDSDAACPVAACRAAKDAPQLCAKCIQAKVSPAQQFFEADWRDLPISQFTLPCTSGGSCTSELEPRIDGTGLFRRGHEACVYGVYALHHGKHAPADHQQHCCSQDARFDRPEIHPFDAIWWRLPGSGLDGWAFGIFQDDSGRFSSPVCSGGSASGVWSQPPRDVTFRFPFSFARAEAPKKACLRHRRTPGPDGVVREVVPLNVSTSAQPSAAELRVLRDGASVVLEVDEPSGFEGETSVRIEGCVTDGVVKGYITVHAAVGCGGSCNLKALNPNGQHDLNDRGSGFLYDELTLVSGDCP